MTPATPESRTVVFGVFDRHNLGDLPFADIVAALLPGRDLVFAGITDRDLTAWGGHRVQALARELDAAAQAVPSDTRGATCLAAKPIPK